MNKKFLLLIVAVALIGLVGWTWKIRMLQQSQTSVADDKIRVVASFYPLADFARQVGQDRVTVINLTPAGAEPHEYEPTPQDLVALRKAQVFIYNGASLEPWVDRVLPDLQAGDTVIVKSSEGISLRPTDSSNGAGTAPDPHFWLDPVLARQMVDTIARGLKRADSGNPAWYERTASEFKTRLSELDNQFKQALARCARRDIVTSHQVFGYLADRYHLNALSISGLSPDEEPSPQKLAEVSAFARQHNLKYIFFESLVSPRLADTIAREVGAQTLVFNPLEGLSDSEIAQGWNYLSVQKDNLANLKRTLECI